MSEEKIITRSRLIFSGILLVMAVCGVVMATGSLKKQVIDNTVDIEKNTDCRVNKFPVLRQDVALLTQQSATFACIPNKLNEISTQVAVLRKLMEIQNKTTEAKQFIDVPDEFYACYGENEWEQHQEDMEEL